MGLEDLTEDSLEKAVLADLDNEITKSINDEMRYYLMMQYYAGVENWTKVTLDKLQDNRHAVDITYWLEEQGFVDKEDYYRDGREFIFLNPKHATLFTLRWV